MHSGLKQPGWAFLAVLLCAHTLLAQSSLEDQLRTALVGKTLRLKTTCISNRLTYNPQGTLAKECNAGPWKVFSLFHPSNVKVSDSAIEVTGTREVDAVIASDGNGESSFPAEGSTILTFQLTVPPPDLAAANAVVAMAFDSDKDRAEALGPHHDLLIPATPAVVSQPGVLLPVAGLGRVPPMLPRDPVSLPKVISAPDPEYSTEARKAKVSGAVVLAVVLDERGRPEAIQIIRRLGYGLDEEAIISVSSWRFEPAMKDGIAVAAKINVEVVFNLMKR